MNTSSNKFTDKLAGIVDWLTQKREPEESLRTAETLYPEINQLKEVLSNAPTRPSRIVRNESLEPITEQQKILDLAG